MAVSLIISLNALLVTSDVALASCNPNRAHAGPPRFAGVAVSMPGVNGVSSTIKEYNPFYTGQSGTGTNATIMLANSSLNRWAQFGYFKSKIADGVTIKRQVGIEIWRDGGDNHWEFWPGEPIGQHTWYEITRFDNGNINFFLEGSYIWSDHAPWTPAVYEMFGEITDQADQLPGARLNPVDFNNANYFLPPGQTPHISVADFSTQMDFFGVANPYNGKYQMWDEACAT